MIRRNPILSILLIPGLLSALYLLFLRFDVEMRNRSVEVTLDYSELQNLSASSSTPIPILLTRFKAAGATGVAVTEQLLSDLSATGEIFYASELKNNRITTYIHVRNPALKSRLEHVLKARIGTSGAQAVYSRSGNEEGKASVIVVCGLSPSTLNTMGAGLPPEAVKDVQEVGLDVVARLWNYPGISKRAIQTCLKDLKLEGITRLICAGDEIIGFKGLIPWTAKQLTDLGLKYGSVEFAKQKGDSKLTEELRGDFVRVHSIPYPEMATMDPATAIERFTRAVKERNIRLCYVRLIESNGDDPITTNAQFIYAIRRAIEQRGFRVGGARPFDDVKQPRILLAVIALSIAAAGVLTLESLVTLNSATRFALFALGFVITLSFILLGETGKQLAALITALIFPTLAGVGIIGPYFKHDHHEKPSFVKTVSIFIGASLVTLCGAVIIAGALGTRLYMVKVEQFVGIKAAHLLPLLFILLVIAAGFPTHGIPAAEAWKRARQNLRSVMAHPLFVWHALAILIASAVLIIALIRTGNEAGIGVSSIELKLRTLLDRLLLVRPRTKEFLIGHPALLLGIALLQTGKRSWGLPLCALGMIGQVSMLNTFCHIHTPLTVTFMRTFNGIILGVVLGVILWAATRNYMAPETDDQTGN